LPFPKGRRVSLRRGLRSPYSPKRASCGRRAGGIHPLAQPLVEKGFPQGAEADSVGAASLKEIQNFSLGETPAFLLPKGL